MLTLPDAILPTLVTNHSAIPEDAVYAAPPSQLKTTPPGNPTREHRDPRSCLTTHDRNRWDLRCWLSQLPRYRSPYVHTVTRLLTGTVKARTPLPIGQTLDAGSGTTKIATGQHQGCSLVYRQPVSLHELHPAHDGTVRRVDRYDFLLPDNHGTESTPSPCHS